jgi:hypothetical protein
MHLTSFGLVAANSMNVTVDPTQDSLPGTAVLESLAGGIGHWALIASIVGVIVGGTMWGSGQRLTTTNLSYAHGAAFSVEHPDVSCQGHDCQVEHSR